MKRDREKGGRGRERGRKREREKDGEGEGGRKGARGREARTHDSRGRTRGSPEHPHLQVVEPILKIQMGYVERRLVAGCEVACQCRARGVEIIDEERQNGAGKAEEPGKGAECGTCSWC